MRIAFVSTCDYATPSGVKNHVCDLAYELTNQGNSVCIIGPSSKPSITSRISNFIQIASFPSAAKTGRHIPPHILLSPKAISRLYKVLNSENFDVVHIQEPLIPPLCISALFHKKTPLFATFHTYYEEGQPLYRMFRPVLNTWLNRLHGRITVSQPATKYIEQYFPYDYKIIPNGVNLDKFSSPVPSIPQLDDSDYINLLFVGHAQYKRKGLHYLLEAFQLLKVTYPKLRLIVTGTRWTGASVPTELNHFDLQDILYLGTVSDEQLAALYQTADIFCAPSIGNESFGIVLIEAMAAGIPIVTTRIEGYMSVVRDNHDALLVPPKDSNALAQAVKQLIDDPALRQRLIEQAKVSVQRYSWKNLAKQTLEYYNEKLSQGFSPS
ncbi:TPA: glycosyltransferase family 4 protein [Legionella anisa]